MKLLHPSGDGERHIRYIWRYLNQSAEYRGRVADWMCGHVLRGYCHRWADSAYGVWTQYGESYLCADVQKTYRWAQLVVCH